MEIAWIAALMPKRLKRLEEDAVDLVELKEEISRFAAPLRQSAIYLVGLCRLLSRRVEYLQSSYFHVEQVEDVSPASKPRKRQAPQALAVIDEALPPPPTPISARSAVTPLPLADDFSADFTPDFDGSEASIRKRPRMSILSDVLDDLRGEDFDRMEDQMHAHPRDSEASRPDLEISSGAKNRRIQLSRRVVKEFNDQSGKSRGCIFGVPVESGLCFLPVTCQVKPVETAETMETGLEQDAEEWPEANDVNDENHFFTNEPTACTPIPSESASFSSLVKSNGRIEAVRLFSELLSLKCRGQVELENKTPGSFGDLRICSNPNWQY